MRSGPLELKKMFFFDIDEEAIKGDILSDGAGAMKDKKRTRPGAHSGLAPLIRLPVYLFAVILLIFALPTRCFLRGSGSLVSITKAVGDKSAALCWE